MINKLGTMSDKTLLVYINGENKFHKVLKCILREHAVANVI